MNCYIYYAVTLKGIANNGDSMRVVTAIPALIEFPFLFMKKEVWKDIPGYEGKYQASNLGRVKGIKGVMKGYNNKGYIYINIYGLKKAVHRIIGITFLGLDHNNRKIFVCHKNDIKDDNRVENLFLGTAKDNIHDMIKKGRRVQGNKCIGVCMLHKGEKIKEFKSLREATKYIKGTDGNISKCCSGVRNTYLGYGWKFINN